MSDGHESDVSDNELQRIETIQKRVSETRKVKTQLNRTIWGRLYAAYGIDKEDFIDCLNQHRYYQRSSLGITRAVFDTYFLRWLSVIPPHIRAESPVGHRHNIQRRIAVIATRTLDRLTAPLISESAIYNPHSGISGDNTEFIS
jgi:hypothetical protein